MTFDHIVVGGGTAGAIVAARLAERPGARIALLEAGPSDEGDARVLTLRDWPDLLEGPLDFDYRIEPQPRGNGAIRHARGKVLGGCSSHNSCIAFVPPDRDFADWAARGAAGWGPADVAPFFDRVLEKVPLSDVEPDNACGRAFVQAAEQAGFPLQRFNREPLRSGVGWFQLNQRGGVRLSSSVAYLHPLKQWGDRLTVRTGEMVRRIIVEGGRAVGVLTDVGELRCDGEVIVCCGAFDSPRLLLLSGIGPADDAKRLGIDVVADRPGVGENLLDHPEGVVMFESAREVPTATTQFWEIGLFAETVDGLDCPDLMFHFGTVPFDMHTAPAGYPTATYAFSMTPNVARARSQGRVWLRSADPKDPPRIDFRYFTDPDGHDERVMLAGVHLARRIAQQPALAPWIARELAPGAAVTDDAALSAYVRRTANTVYHPAGTCRVGDARDALAVVDPALRVIGVDGLRVADASIFPSMTTTNPCITAMMIGERAAALVGG